MCPGQRSSKVRGPRQQWAGLPSFRLLAPSGTNVALRPTGPLISVPILEVAGGGGERKGWRSQGQVLGGGQGQGAPETPRQLGPGGLRGWQGPDAPSGWQWRPPRGQEGAEGGGAGRGHQSPSHCPDPGVCGPLGTRPPPPPGGQTSIRLHPDLPEAGGAPEGALGLLGILRVPALQVAQVDGLEGCENTGQSAAGTGGNSAQPCPLRKPEDPAAPPSHSLFRLGFGTFSTYSSTRPRSLPGTWLRRSRSTPCQAAGRSGQLRALAQGQSPLPGEPRPLSPYPSEGPRRPSPRPTIPLVTASGPQTGQLWT